MFDYDKLMAILAREKLTKYKFLRELKKKTGIQISNRSLYNWRDGAQPVQANIRMLCEFFGVDNDYFNKKES